MATTNRNPHFDDHLLIWDDAYSGRYAPPSGGYSDQFDLQWKLALDGDPAYYNYSGASVDEDYIEDRVFEWTGQHPSGRTSFKHRVVDLPSNGHAAPSVIRAVAAMKNRQTDMQLDEPLDPEIIRGRKCIDVACGMGRWTKTMQKLGAASVMSIDMSPSGLASVSRFNPTTRQVNVMRLREEHPDLVGQFDFANFWGVAMCTHDPKVAFMNAASTVRPGGYLYLMVYAPEGIHGTKLTLAQRTHFHKLTTVSDRLEYVDRVYDRRWDAALPLGHNVTNVIRNALRWPKGSKIGWLDLLEPTFNWVIPLSVAKSWFAQAGFSEPTLLNKSQSPKCAFHLLGQRLATDL